jgi:FkbM family methyltransferase
MLFMKQNGLEISTIIDVGIAYGTPGLYGPFEDVKYHLIEPLKEYKNVIEGICSTYDATYTLAAAGEELGELQLNVHPDLSGSSVLNESEGKHVDGEPRTVPVTTIDHEIEQFHLKGPYLIKIDVQGFELQVLNGAHEALKNTEAVLLEVSLFEFYKGSPSFADVIDYMNRYNFSVYEIYTPTYRPLDDAMGQVDIAFVKTDGKLRKTSHYATKDQRKEMTQKRINALNPKS